MPKRGHEATSSSGSPMAKPKPMIPAKARPTNPPQDLRDPVNPENVDEGQGGQTSLWKQWRTNQSQDPIEYSQVRRQENLQHADSWKHGERSQTKEHKVSQTKNGFDVSMKEAARRGSSTARISKIPWLTFEQFKDTLVE